MDAPLFSAGRAAGLTLMFVLLAHLPLHFSRQSIREGAVFENVNAWYEAIRALPRLLSWRRACRLELP
jgi:hypothetical protein